MKTLVYRWLKANITIFVNAGSLVGTTLITSVLGFVYWWIAARQFPPDAVGFTSAALSAMTLLGTLSILGVGTMLTGELPRQQGKEASLIGVALLVVGTVGACLGALFALLAPLLSANFQPLRASLGDVLLFAAGVSFTAISLVLDQALIGLLRSDLQLGRNTLFAVTKLAILFIAGLWLSHTVGLTIYTTWTLGNVFSVVALVGIAALKGKWRERSYRPQWEALRKLGPEALKHHLLNLTLLAPAQLMPILVAIVLSTRATAWFYVSSMLANFIFIIPLSLTMVLYATSSAQPATLANKARLTIVLATVICLVANGVVLVGAKQILGLFGQSYAEEAAWSLRILGLGAFPLIVRNHYLAIHRIQGRVLDATLPMIAGGCLELVGTVVGAHVGGLAGLSLGWLIAVSVVAMGTSRTVYKALQPVKTFIKASDIEHQQSYTPYAERTQLLDMQANEVKMRK